jgi:hypothetical protein
MIEFKKVLHQMKSGVEIVEVWVNGKFRATIYPDSRDPVIRIVSSHLEGEPENLTPQDNMKVWQFKFK